MGSYQAAGNTPGDPAHTTTLQYNDPMWRLTQIQSPADPSGHNPVTTINYPDANTVERLKTITASLTDDSFAYFDGVGRHTKSVHTSAGSATTVTSYDADGRVASVTNPYFTVSDPTYGTTQTKFDGLGRVTQTTKQDGSTVKIQYNQSAAVSTNSDCTLITDEAGDPRQTCKDGLDRLIEVDEPSKTGIGSSAGQAASGWISISGSDPATYKGSVTITGSEGYTISNPCLPKGNCPFKKYDTGNVGFSINGIAVSTSYQQGSTTSSVASALAAQFNGTSVTATIDPANSSQIDLAAAGGISFSSNFGIDFKASFNGASLNSDSGNVSVVINGTSVSAPYSAGSTPASIAAQLVQNVNAATSLVTASVPSGGSTVTFTCHHCGAGW